MKKLSVVGVTAVTFGVMATAAAADTKDVWLWACQAPGNVALGGDPIVTSATNTPAVTDTCDEAGGSLTMSLAGSEVEVPGNAAATARFDVPPGLTLQKVDVTRTTAGFAGAQQDNPQRYTVSAGNVTLESASLTDAAPANLTGNAVFDATGASVRLGVECNSPNPCAASAPVSVNVGRVGLKVTDNQKPAFAVGGSRSPASNPMTLDVRASDVGTGLWKAEAFINGVWVNGKDFQSACRELTPGDATADLALGAKCADVSNVDLPIDTKAFTDGPGYELLVRVTDWAGNESEYRQTIEILNVLNLGSSTQTLNIGTSGVPNPVPQTRNNNSGVAGAQAQSCSSPRLSFSLAQKPMRVSRGTPVLQKNKRYRFTGRLTCVIRNKRVSAPKRTRVDIFNKVGKKTIEKAGTTVGDKGRLSIILSYPRSRTITFRFTNSDGRRSQVSIKVKVESKKKAGRR